ncbi:MAG TPA: GAF domain-containing protein, partial [Chloroflexia bacterium]|nr:GAF domain-containing protein [Chloroflexia bacterium]
MTANQLIQYLSWIIYVAIFASAAVHAVRHPLRANTDIALLFSVPMLIIVVAVAQQLTLVPAQGVVSAVSFALLLAIGYMLLRLVDDFSEVPPWLMRLAEVSLAGLVGAAFLFPAPAPPWLTALLLAYLIGFLSYAGVAFLREAQRARGVTRRRMWAAAGGSLWLGAAFLIGGLQLLLPQLSGLWQLLSGLAGLASGLSYWIGFAPPGLLRRAWQEPELRAFLGRAARLPRLPTTAAIVEELERGAALAVGAPYATIGQWDAAAGVLHFNDHDRPVDLVPDDRSISGRAFSGQRPVFSDNLKRDTPAMAAANQESRIKAILAAPITAGDQRLGVLVVYAPHTSIFADEDLALVQLLADQAAVILESRALIDEAARVRAREEVTRLKEDFLSAAAHDLKSPLTTLVAQTQLLERKALRTPEAPVDLASIQKLGRETQRLKTLVLELLDAARTEQGRLVGSREAVDLVALARDSCARH